MIELYLRRRSKTNHDHLPQQDEKDNSMTETKFKRAALPLTFAAVTAGSVLTASPTLAATSTTYKGATESYRWGTIQVSVVVKSKKITNVKATYVPHTARSQFIEDNAVPQLKQEVLQAQSVSIDTVSGATD